MRDLQFLAAGCVLGCIMGLAWEHGRADRFLDYALRIQQQYAGCMVVGDFPTQADMITNSPGD